MLEDCVRDGGIDAFLQRVDAAHRPLQLGELAHHAGGEVRLAELGGVGELAGLAAAGGAVQPERELADPLDALQLGAEALQEGAAAELFQPRAERHLAVLVEEELPVGEAGPQHPLVALAAGGGIANPAVRDRHEGRQQLALVALDGEVLLVAAHLGDQHLGRQLEVLPLEMAGDGGRLLDQAGDRLQELGVGPGDAAGLARGARHLLRDALAALGPVRQHVGLAQRRDVIAR